MMINLKSRIQNRQSTIAIIGLGYVGLPLAIRFSEEGFKTIGFDIDKEKVDLLNNGKSYIKHIKKLKPEPWLPEDIQIAINTFIEATIMVEENDLPYIPTEYVISLLDAIKKHKEYNSLYLELVEMLLPEFRQAAIDKLDE